MTIDEFLARLKEERIVRRLTFRYDEGSIRTADDKRLCPICVVAFTINNGEAQDDAVDLLGLSPHDAADIIDAADRDTGMDIDLHNRLVEACGLEPYMAGSNTIWD